MGLPATIEKLIYWLLDRKAKRSASVDAYLKEVQDACRRLVSVSDPASDEAFLLHEEIRQAYELASSKLPPALIQAHGGPLYRALSSARIYYWLRVVEAGDEEELQALFADRRRWSSSFELLGNLLWEAAPQEGQKVGVDKLDLQRVREICLRDIQLLSEIRQLSS